MFKWAQSLSTKVASSLSDTFAPLFRSNLEQLQDAWRKVEGDFHALLADGAAAGSSQDDPKLLLESPIIAHLNQMVEALVKEEEEQARKAGAASNDDYDASGSTQASSPFDNISGKGDNAKSTTGPCFEYFLNEKILDKLCALGLPDVSEQHLHQLASSARESSS
jgi:hypothetical protein